MSTLDVEQARTMLKNLRVALEKVTAKDPEQEVRGMALPVLDAVIGEVRVLVPESPIVGQVSDIISPENIQRGEPIRAVDVLLVVNILLDALPRGSSWADVYRQDAPPQR